MAITNIMQCNSYPKVGTLMVCPICGKEFKATDDTRYIRLGEYTCSWKCFLTPGDKKSPLKVNPVISKEVEQSTKKPPQKSCAKEKKQASTASNKQQKSAKIASNNSNKSAKVDLF